jgi:AraC-like DNA-binding protein
MQRPAQPQEFEIVRRTPSPALAGVVTDIASYRELAPGAFRQWEPASLVVPLVIGFDGPFDVGIGTAPTLPWQSFVAGLWAGPVAIESRGDACCLQVNFTPLGARRFFGLPMSELASRMVEPEQVLGPAFSALRDRLGDTAGWPERFAMVEAFIAGRLERAALPPLQVELAYRRIVETGGQARISRIAAGVEWSRKHLAEKFVDQVGLTPKAVARIVRLERAIAMARSGAAGGLADVAAACGFADQPHLNAEFRVLAGATPMEFFARAA